MSVRELLTKRLLNRSFPPNMKVAMSDMHLYVFLSDPTVAMPFYQHYDEGNYKNFYDHLQNSASRVLATTTLLSHGNLTYGKSPHILAFNEDGYDYGCRTPFLDELEFGMSIKEIASVLRRHMKLSCYDDSSIFYLGYVEPFENKAPFDFEDFYVMERGKVLELPEGCEWVAGEYTATHHPRVSEEEEIEEMLDSTVLEERPWIREISLKPFDDWFFDDNDESELLSYRIYLDKGLVSVTDDGNPKYMFQLFYSLKKGETKWERIGSRFLYLE
jgi:hypothetical protein